MFGGSDLFLECSFSLLLESIPRNEMNEKQDCEAGGGVLSYCMMGF